MSDWTGLMLWPNHRQKLLTAAQWPPPSKPEELEHAQEHNPQPWKQLKNKQKFRIAGSLCLLTVPPALSRHIDPAVWRVIVKLRFMKTGGDFKPLFKVERLIFLSLLACHQASDNKAIEVSRTSGFSAFSVFEFGSRNSVVYHISHRGKAPLPWSWEMFTATVGLNLQALWPQPSPSQKTRPPPPREPMMDSQRASAAEGADISDSPFN